MRTEPRLGRHLAVAGPTLRLVAPAQRRSALGAELVVLSRGLALGADVAALRRAVFAQVGARVPAGCDAQPAVATRALADLRLDLGDRIAQRGGVFRTGGGASEFVGAVG